MDVVYLDNNATTKPDPQVVQAMLPFLTEMFGNPSSIHRLGQRARQAVDEARVKVAELLNCADSELMFSGGGTESVNSAIRGIIATRGERKRIVTSAVEHSASRELCAQLGKEGFQIITIDVDQRGVLDMDRLRASIDDSVAVGSIMWANNETGVMFPVQEIARLCRDKRVPFHCDATQAVGKIPVDLKAIEIDAASCAPHKFHGPKGVGVSFIRRGVRFKPLLIGGPQERGRRGGTENVPAIVGSGVAAQLAREHLSEMPRVAEMRDRFERSILESIPDSHRIGGEPRVPNTCNIGFARLEAEAILLLLSEQGICASAGSACSSGSLEPSPILRAMKIDEKIAHGAIRFSLSRFSTDREIDTALSVLPGVIQRLRAVLPVG